MGMLSSHYVSSKVNTKSVIDECIEKKQEIPENIKHEGRVVGLSTLYFDIEDDLIQYYENGFTDKEPIEIMKLKLNDMLKYVEKILSY